MSFEKYVIEFSKLCNKDVPRVGGKNASLGEMIGNLAKSGVKVPGGFATTADAFREFLAHNGLADKIAKALSTLKVEDVHALTQTGRMIRSWVEQTPLPQNLQDAILTSYRALSKNDPNFAVAVRSSATAEDLPEASFAGQQETLLNVRGEDAVLKAVKSVFASLFNDRAITYRVHHGFAHEEVALSAGIQQMARSDVGASGVMFTLDTETGFDGVILINAAFGLGEMVVQGAVNPDEFYVYKESLRQGKPSVVRRHLGHKHLKMIYADTGSGVKVIEVPSDEQARFALSDNDIEFLGQQALIIEKHYGRPMDIEWAKDGVTGDIYILQARPETVKSRDNVQVMSRYELQKTSTILTQGRAIGQKIGQGTARVISSIRDMDRLKQGEVLVTDMTDPDWEPVMKRAAAIVTNRGGRTCHAAIIARELGIPAVVGCGEATRVIKEDQPVTVSCAEGEVGNIYEGLLGFEIKEHSLNEMPSLPFKIMMNVGNPERAFDFQRLPNEGVGLARLEFLISQMIGIHPKACLEYQTLPPDIQQKIDGRIAGYATPVDFYWQKLAEGIATLGVAFSPKRVIIRFSDFKSNEYANLIGGQRYEPKEENPMLGFRGASRYVADSFKDCFALECKAVKYVREQMGINNIEVMVPFVRTLTEAKAVIEVLAQNGLKRGEHGLKIIMMCELPTNALLAEDYLEFFDGFSIGSNDLTQLTLGLDRDSGLVASQFDERDPAVKVLISKAIQACLKAGKYIGICGQGPSDHPDLADWLMKQGIESVSLNPDTVLETWLFLGGQKDAKV
ncbi:MAG: phosphoenolpyruvate synthase [Gammaproteobacteria bacterium]